VPVPDESGPLFDDGSVAVLGLGEVAAAGAVDLLAGADAPWPLVQPVSSTINPLATMKLPLWNPMLVTTPQPLSRCAIVMLLRSVDSWSVRDRAGAYRCKLVAAVASWCRSRSA
jgi:hypothetical protein